MAKYIDKDAVVAWIRNRLLPTANSCADELERAENNERISILNFINTLEVNESDARGFGILWSDKEKPEMTKHQIANDYVAKATRALVDAIKEDIIEIGKKCITIHTLACEYGENIEEGWKVTRKGDEITFSNGGEKYSIEDLSISTLIDISNALLSDNYE